jgi:hypothetical protein
MLRETDPNLLPSLKIRLDDAANHIGDLIAVQEEMQSHPDIIEEFQSYERARTGQAGK